MTQLKTVDPAAYRIVVQGALDDRWSGRLGGLSISIHSAEEDHVVTALEGLLPDQAALMSVLNLLSELHMPLESVTLLGAPNEERDSE